MQASNETGDWAKTARDLFLVAMAVFVVTIIIGILNGADAVEFNRDQILTHVHSGTVGWLTLSIVASAFLLFRAADRRLMLTLAILVPLYVLAFYTGSFALRAIGGTALLIAIAWLLVWLWGQYLGGERSLSRLAVTLGITSFGYGAVVGVLMQIGFALGVSIIPGDAIGAHASAMTFGYLVLAAMGLIEWRVLGTRGLPVAGVIQVGALFVGGLVISLGLMAGVEQAAGGIYLLTQLVSVVLFAVRVLPTALRRSWLAADPSRHLALAAIWTVVALVLFMYIVFTFISKPDDPNALPVTVLIASDHSVYLGVITNIVLGLLSTMLLRRDAAAWLSHVVFWGVNGGLAVFVIGLILDSPEIKRVGAPVMGVALLVALAILATRLWSGRLDTAELEPA
ncbi:MAG: hypothetical protein ABI622_09275 [Chloroflexota bacterium]